MIFPKLETSVVATGTATNLPLYTDWAYDFDGNCLALRGGRNYTVSGREALKIWIYKALQTPRAVYPAYSHDYGQDFARHRRENNLPALDERIAACVKEALLVNPYITGVREFAFEHKLDVCAVHCVVDTVYGATQTQTEVALA